MMNVACRRWAFIIHHSAFIIRFFASPLPFRQDALHLGHRHHRQPAEEEEEQGQEQPEAAEKRQDCRRSSAGTSPSSRQEVAVQPS